MKPDRMAVAADLGTGTELDAVATIANNTHTTFSHSARHQRASSEPRFVPARMGARPHTLVLTGELDRASAHALEAEIDRLCDEGVTGITLDLRQLTYIDSIGVAVIAFRCGLCQRRGYEVVLIPGSRFIHRAFEQAGVTDLLPFHEDEVAAARLPALVLGYRSREGCER